MAVFCCSSIIRERLEVKTMLKVYAVSVLAMYEPQKGPPQIEYMGNWMILDERKDPEEEAEQLMYEWFPEEDEWYSHSCNVQEVPLKIMKRAVEFNLYEEEPPKRRAAAKEQTR